MDTQTALLTRRTSHYWKAEAIPAEAVQLALEAAHMAPCHRYTWPWRFTLVGSQTRSSLFDLAVQLKKGTKETLPDRMYQTLVRKVRNPAELIVVSMTRCDDDFTHRENYAAVACAIQNLTLSLHASGYGSKWSTGKITRHVKTYKMLSLDSTQEEIVGFIWAGIPETAPSTPERPVLSTFVRKVD